MIDQDFVVHWQDLRIPRLNLFFSLFLFLRWVMRSPDGYWVRGNVNVCIGKERNRLAVTSGQLPDFAEQRWPTRRVNIMKMRVLLLALAVGMSLSATREAVCVERTMAATGTLDRDRSLGVARSPFDVAIKLYRGKLIIDGTSWNDHVEVNNVVADTIEVVTFRTARRQVERSSRSYPADLVDSIQFNGENGDDYLWTVMIDVPVFARGGNGNDHLEGGANADWLMGGSGDDDLYGRKDDDILIGGYGDDDLYGRRGDDCLLGGEGTDSLHGGYGDDYLDGGKDGRVDTLEGGEGCDVFVGYYTRYHVLSSTRRIEYTIFTDTEPEDHFSDFDETDDTEKKTVKDVFLD